MADIIQTSGIPAPTYANGILDYALNVAPLGVTVISPRNMGSTDLPSDVNMYGAAIILKRASTSAISVTLITDSNMYETITNTYYSSTWHGWKMTTGAYCTSQTRWDSLLSKAELHIGFPFCLSGAGTNAIFGLGTSYYTNGVVAVNSATSATGFFNHNGTQYTFEYNPTAGTLTSLNKYSPRDTGEIVWHPDSSTSSDTFTFNGTTRALFQTFYSNANLCSQFHVYCTSTGTASVQSGTQIGGSGFTFDVTTANKLKISHASATIYYVIKTINGSVTPPT